MKKLVLILISASFLSSCAHRYGCSSQKSACANPACAEKSADKKCDGSCPLEKKQ